MNANRLVFEFDPETPPVITTESTGWASQPLTKITIEFGDGHKVSVSNPAAVRMVLPDDGPTRIEVDLAADELEGDYIGAGGIRTRPTDET